MWRLSPRASGDPHVQAIAVGSPTARRAVRPRGWVARGSGGRRERSRVSGLGGVGRVGSGARWPEAAGGSVGRSAPGSPGGLTRRTSSCFGRRLSRIPSASRPGPASLGLPACLGLRPRRFGTPGPVGGLPVVSVSGGRTPDVRVAGALRLLVPRLLIAPDCGCSASGVGLSRRPGPARHSDPLHSGTPAPAESRSWPAPDSGLPVAVMSAPVVVSAVPETSPRHPRPAPGWNV